MNEEAAKLFEQLESRKQKLLDELDAMDEGLLNYKPSAKEWSFLQVIQHLMKSEELSISYMNKKLQAPGKLQKAGIAERFRALMLKIALVLPVKYKAPYGVSDIPEQADYSELKQRWHGLRQQMADLLQEVPDELVHTKLFKHPIVGRMNLLQAIEFLNQHFDHHLYQVKRLKDRLPVLRQGTQ